MKDVYESPSFAVSVPHTVDTEKDALLNGARLWDDIPNAITWGEQYQDQLRTARHPLGCLAIIGDCFASEEDIAKALDRTLRSQEVDHISYLPGRYSAVLLEPTKTTALASVVGTPTLYYQRYAGQTVISTRAALTDKAPSLDSAQLASRLVIPGLEGSLLFGQESCYTGVSKLHGGQALQVHNGRERIFTYEPLSPKHTTLESAAMELQTALEESIRARATSGHTISCDLSGGTDSGTLSWLLTRHQGDKLETHFGGNPDLQEGDIQHAKRQLSLNDRLHFNYFDSRRIGESFSVNDFQEMPRAEDAGIALNAGVYNYKYIATYFANTSQSDRHLHVTGNGGDEVLKVGGEYLSDLFRPKTLGRFSKETLEWARLYNVSPLEMGKHMARLATNPDGDITQSVAILEGRVPGNANKPILDIFGLFRPVGAGLPLLTPEARHAIADLLREQGPAAIEGQTFGNFKALEGLRATGYISQMVKYYANIGSPHVSAQSPFLDNNVVRAAFSVATIEKGSPRAFKPLLEMAMAGVVPTEITARTSKGAYDEAATQILSRSAQAISEILENSRLAEAGIIDRDATLRTLSAVDRLSVNELWTLERIINAEGWLQNQDSEKAISVLPKSPAITLQASESSADKPTSHESPLFDASTQFCVAPTIRSVLSPSRTLVLFNERTNNYFHLDPMQSNVVRALGHTNSIDGAAAILSRAYPNIERSRITEDLRKSTQDFIEHGILIASDNPQPKSFPNEPNKPRFVSGEFSTARQADTDTKPTIRQRVAAGTALMIGEMVIGKIAPHKKMPLLRLLQEKWCNTDTTQTEAKQILGATQALPYLGRIACLEASYTSALAAALSRRKLAFHQGITFQPTAYHAWVEAEDRPVRTPLDGQVIGSFQSFYES